MRILLLYLLTNTRRYRHWQCYCITFIVIAVMFMFDAAFLTKTTPKTRPHSRKSLSATQFFELINSKYGQRRILERVEMEDGTHLFVFDQWSLGKEILVKRTITGDFVHEHSSVLLETPAELSEINTDTTKWSVQHGLLRTGSCYQLLVETVFDSGAIGLSHSSNAKMLMIGLGGGIVNGFLHFYIPKMDITVVEISAQMVYIARKWFGMHFNDRHRIVIEDGAKFVEKEARNGRKYNAVLIDACDSLPAENVTIICPVSVFLEESFIKNTAQLMTNTGVAAFNVFSYTLTSDKVRELLTHRFSKYFDYCNTKETKVRNVIFYCMLHRPREEKQIDLMQFVQNIS
ncbi:hypothetical protein Y032_0320g2404 [Ancylostoma ceylanicum]|nr:hypothetical protein Y032_0320g2404 [Ancylostoma ceylanicum]